jgi:hypothetical protein
MRIGELEWDGGKSVCIEYMTEADSPGSDQGRKLAISVTAERSNIENIQ